jgi:outer membrane murein-binding lipoprotein Lpp
MKKFLLTAASLSVLLLSGCASSLMSPDENAGSSIPKDKAVITFFRTSVLGGAIQAPISEASSDGG